MRTLWISGAGGFVGGRLVERTARSGHYDRIQAFDLVNPSVGSPAVL
jgi:hypothetical protein